MSRGYLRSYWYVTPTGPAMRCWRCGTPLLLPDLKEGEEKQVRCPGVGCGFNYVFADPAGANWAGHFLVPGGLNKAPKPDTAAQDAIRFFLDAWDRNEPIGEVIDVLRDAVKGPG